LGLPAAPSPAARTAATRGDARRRRKEREIVRDHLLPRLAGSATMIVCAKGCGGRVLAAQADELGPMIVRPRRQREPKTRYQLRLATIRQRIESVFWTMKARHRGLLYDHRSFQILVRWRPAIREPLMCAENAGYRPRHG
jgi:hypothetical protein